MTKAQYAKLVKDYHTAKLAADKAKDIADQLKAAIKADGMSKLESGGYIVSITEVSTTWFDSTRFKADHADLYQQYSVPNTTTRLNIK